MTVQWIVNLFTMLLQCFPWPKWGARCSWWTCGWARIMRRAPRAARRNMRPDAPIKNYTIKHNVLIVNKRQTIRFVLLQCYALYECTWMLITVKSTLDPINVSFNFSYFFRKTQNMWGALFLYLKKKNCFKKWGGRKKVITYQGKHCYCMASFLYC